MESGDALLILKKRIRPMVNNLPLFLPPARHCTRQLLELDFLRLSAVENGFGDVGGEGVRRSSRLTKLRPTRAAAFLRWDVDGDCLSAKVSESVRDHMVV